MIQGFQGSSGFAFILGAASVAEFIAKDVSSPQTVHLNAKRRAPTLMQWVHVGMIESALFIGITALVDRKHAKAFIAGAALEMAVTEGLYLYARQLGLQEGGATTEQHDADHRQEGGFVYG